MGDVESCRWICPAWEKCPNQSVRFLQVTFCVFLWPPHSTSYLLHGLAAGFASSFRPGSGTSVLEEKDPEFLWPHFQQCTGFPRSSHTRGRREMEKAVGRGERLSSAASLCLPPSPTNYEPSICLHITSCPKKPFCFNSGQLCLYAGEK